MGSSHAIAFAISFVATLAISTSQFSTANAASKPDRVREFEAGPGWFVYDERVDVALHVLNPASPNCHEIGEIVLLFETRDQLRDDELIRQAALIGMKGAAPNGLKPQDAVPVAESGDQSIHLLERNSQHRHVAVS